MGLVRRAAGIVVPLGLVVGAVAYGMSHHHSGSESTVGQCRTRANGRTVVTDVGQARNATLISAISVRRGMPPHAATIALATALQESKLRNLPGGDRDSIGLFQQRPSQGWGTRAQVRNPVHATNAFYDALARIPGYQTIQVTVAAQRVQRSGYPSAYAVHEQNARALASALTGYSPAAFTCHLAARSEQSGQVPVAQRALAVRRSLGVAFGPVATSVLPGARLAISAGDRPRGWALASYLVARASALDLRHVAYAGRTWEAGSDTGWTRGATDPAGSVVVD